MVFGDTSRSVVKSQQRVRMERNPSSHKNDPVIGVEHDPLIGRQEPEELSEEWVKLARRNVNEVPELRKERIARYDIG